MASACSQSESPWPHRLAVLLAGVTFPLIWAGGLVTSYDAGMAVPDWPNTYGYNLLLYPWQSWLTGPWNLFLEHSHRLLGALVGLLTITVTLAVFHWDRRTWVRGFTLAALAAVSGQGLLGGMRVLLDARLLAMVHGCVAPAFFAMTVALTVFTSRWWQEAYQAGWNVPRSTARGGLLTTVVVYIQIVLGAVLRHIPVWASPGFFRIAVFFHLVFAAVVVGYLVFLAMRVRRVPQGTSGLRWPIWGMVLLVVVQLTLGCATYVVNYWWPGWAADLGLATIRYTIVEASGRLQSLTMTAHVATGSLLLGLAMLFLVRAQRVCARAVAIPRAREHRVRPRGALA